VISPKIGSGIRVLAARRGVPGRLADSPDVPGNGRGVPVGKNLPSDEHDLLPQAFRDGQMRRSSPPLPMSTPAAGSPWRRWTRSTAEGCTRRTAPNVTAARALTRSPP
jgi:hypothetical protein